MNRERIDELISWSLVDWTLERMPAVDRNVLRIGVYELLQMTPEIKRLIVGWATQDELRRQAQKQGMRSLRDEALNLVVQDTTTISEVIRSIYAM